MSLRIVSAQAGCPIIRTAEDIPVGTWFTDVHDGVYVIAQDDRNGEKRILCLGTAHRPFISSIPPSEFEVKKILPFGTALKICDAEEK